MISFDFVYIRTPLQSLNKAFYVDTNLNPLFKDGLYLASDVYWKQFDKRDALSLKDKEKNDLTFLKYWLRSCTRCTPFGTFAGSAVATINGHETSLVLDDTGNYKRSTRLDMNYLSVIIEKLEQHEEIKKQLKVFANNSIYELPSSFRFAEYTLSEIGRTYQLSAIEKTNYISQILKEAQKGDTINNLAVKLRDIANVSFDVAYGFIAEMWKSQLLVSELEPAVTGGDPIQSLLAKLKQFKNVENIVSGFEQVANLIINDTGIATYIEIERLVEDLFQIKKPKNLIQTDLFLATTHSNVNKSVIDSVVKSVNELMTFSRLAQSGDLNNFKKKFVEKFEKQEVLLNIALDAELGVGYAGVSSESTAGSDWIDDLNTYGNTTHSVEFDYVKQFSLDKYIRYLKNTDDVIEINESELLALPGHDEASLPNGMYIIGSLLKKTAPDERGDYQFDLSSVGGSSSANLLGRFSFSDKELASNIKTLIKAEDQLDPDVIYAEIAHMPEARLGNILLRPLLRDFEIPYLGKSGANPENQILLGDLYVSVVNDEVILRSKKYNKRVIPRLTTAHNFSSKSLPVYKFLCDLQLQNVTLPRIWDWGFLNDQKHLPRVLYKNIIVQKAKWRLKINDIMDEKTRRVYNNEKLREVLSRQLPQLFVIKESDNKLLINLALDESLTILSNFLNKHKQAELEEFLFTGDNCVVHNIHGEPFANEMIIPVKKETGQRKNLNHTAQPPNQIARKFAPGSQWLFFKIYCGYKTAERILSDIVSDFIESGLKKHLFEHFFFIRYSDPQPHLRIRFFNTDIKKQKRVQADLLKILQPFIDNDMVESVVLDTYVRELERYGEDSIEDTESLFFNDSLAIIRISKLLDPETSEKYRILLALRAIDMLLKDFGFTLPEKLQLVKVIADGMINRFNGGATMRKKINAKYKNFQQVIFSHMNAKNDTVNYIDEAISFLQQRSEMNRPVIKRLLDKISDQERGKLLSKLLPSYIHMFMNRLFIGQQLKYELLTYNFLERYYTSANAILIKGS